MKKILLTLTLLLCTVKLNAQVSIDWQKCLGGTKYEAFTSILPTSDGGYILLTETNSKDGDVSGTHGSGSRDIWVVKLNEKGGIQWQKCLGGNQNEDPNSILQTSDGGYIVSGNTQSNDGDVSGLHGEYDIWVVKLNATGGIQWRKCLGGTRNDIGGKDGSILQTSDGGYIISGTTGSNDGDVSGSHGSYNDDVWIVKINATGTILWQKCFGGSNKDEFNSILQTSDGGFILSGTTGSNDGDVSGNHGSYNYDVWIVKINATGTILWQKCFGGSNKDGFNSILQKFNSIIQTSDGGYILSCTTGSNDGDVSGNHGGEDGWIVKLNTTGVIVWQKCLGGTKYEAFTSILPTSDGGYILSGYTNSNDGDVSGNHGASNGWIVKINATGNIVWQKCLGGSGDEYIYSILPNSDGGYILSGGTDSNDGDVSGNHGGNDGWVVKINATGGIEWQKCLGGSGDEYIYSILPNSDGGYILSGGTDSNDGDVSGNHGGTWDGWIVKIQVTGTSTNNLQSIDNVKNSFAIYPNPANTHITLDYDGEIQKVEILDLKGATVYSSIEPKNELNLPQNIQTGYYTVVIQTEEGVVRKELMIER